MFTKRPPRVPSAPPEGDGALRGEWLRSPAGTSSAHAWQIKEPVVAVEGERELFHSTLDQKQDNGYDDGLRGPCVPKKGKQEAG